jgi:integrase
LQVGKRQMTKLTAKKIANLTKRGRYGDGQGLWLRVSVFDTKSWIFATWLPDAPLVMGLGPYPEVSLAEARDRAARKQIRDGIDPIDARREKRMAAKIEAAKLTSLAQCVEEYLETHESAWKNQKHREQWRSTIATYAHPIIGNLPVAAVDTALVLKVLRPIWNKKPETASRLRGRIERILAWATVSEYRQGENPARWRGHLQEMLPAKTKVQKIKHHAALPYADVPAFMAQLRGRDGISARALEFTILNANRTGEVIGAKWEEISLEDKVWIVPGVSDEGG